MFMYLIFYCKFIIPWYIEIMLYKNADFTGKFYWQNTERSQDSMYRFN